MWIIIILLVIIVAVILDLLKESRKTKHEKALDKQTDLLKDMFLGK